MQIRRKVIEGVCVWQVREDHLSHVWRRVHILQNTLRLFDMQIFSGASLPERRWICLLGHHHKQGLSVLSILGTQGGSSLRFPKEMGKIVNSANAVLTHRDKSCSSLAWHPHCFPASRTGRESQCNNSCSGAIGPPTAIKQCQGCMDARTRTASPNSRRWNWFSDADVLEREQKEESRCQAVCSTALPSQAPLWSNNSFKGRKGRKNNHPAVC